MPDLRLSRLKWVALLGEGRTLAEICDTMLDEYDLERATLERDLSRLVAELAANGLIEGP